jgi:hypothetical protein
MRAIVYNHQRDLRLETTPTLKFQLERLVDVVNGALKWKYPPTDSLCQYLTAVEK